MVELNELLGYAPGIAAAFLSAYNWYTMRKGADLKIDPFIYYGIQNLSYLENDDGTRKVLFLPVSILNDGVRNGTVRDVQVWVRDGSNCQQLYLDRRINRDEIPAGGDSYSKDELVEVVPALPLGVPPQESVMALFEVRDEEMLPLDKQVILEIRVTYSGKKTSSVEIPMMISHQQWEVAESVHWHRNDSQ